MKEWQKFLLYLSVFLAAYLVPFGNPKIQAALLESFAMLGDYAREHVLFCLIPAFFIAGAISLFVSQQAVLKYFGSQAKKWVSYSVASVSGTILAVCSCTVLPLFAGIYMRGAGIGPATAFLYSGPAINVLAIILTGRILGWQLGLARAVGAVVFAVIIGLTMTAIYGKEDQSRERADFTAATSEEEKRSGWQNLMYFANLVLILIFAAWAKPQSPEGFWYAVYRVHWPVTIGLLLILGYMLWRWFGKAERTGWVMESWDYAKKILPLLLVGVLAAGFLMGRPGTEAGIIPSNWISTAVGGNSLAANLFASIVGAFMYFATLTEVPILQGLLGAGMGQGPALALLLAGPALSLPNMLVIRSVLGTKKTLTYIALVVIMASVSGMIFGSIV
ncbi:permease [Metallumcola ferriviriculae]|uniref:Permease n=1 Tax=Metallumcola ferriviriculae TaxID=3039180 RepID=A0AAU0UNH5_9FIRM|nr:permease [Desulfitibacteraceae bacterium MK1]